MKPIHLLLFHLIFALNLHAQVTDSLLAVLPHTKDTTRVQVLNNLCYEYIYSEPEVAKKYGYEALQYARQIHYVLGEAKALIRIAIIYDVSGKYDSAIYFNQQAGVRYSNINNVKGKASAINNIGMLYAGKGKFSRALGNYFEALRLFTQINDEQYIANVYNNIGIIHADLYKHKLAYEYFSRSAAINLKMNNISSLASNYTNMGRNLDDMGQRDSALYYFKQAEILEKASNNLYGLSALYNNLALTYSDMKDPQKAIFYLRKALAIKIELNDQAGQASTLLNIAGEYKTSDRVLYEKYLKESHAIAESINSYRMLRKTSWLLMKVYSGRKDFEKALQYADMVITARDSVLNEESSNQIAELEAKYENEKQSLEIDKANLALDKAQLEIKQKQSTIITLFIICVLILTIGFGIYKRYRYIQQRKLDAQLLSQQELRNKAIIEAEERERIRIARELHDGIGQQLSAAKMNLSAFESKIDSGDRDNYELLLQLVDDAVKEVRAVSHNMMPNALIRSGLVSAVRDFVHKISATDSLKVDLQIIGLKTRLEATTETVLYRVLQECVSNIIKHARASEISIQMVQHDTHLSMIIEDNGRGFDTKMMNAAEGIGIKNMLSRVHFLNGTIEFDSTPNRGTTIVIEVPIAP